MTSTANTTATNPPNPIRQSLYSEIVDLTLSDTEPENSKTAKRNGSHLAPSITPTKKYRNANGTSQSPNPPLPIRSAIKQRIPEKNIRTLAGWPDGPSLIPPKNLYANVLVKPQLHLTPRTAAGFNTSDNARPPVDLDKNLLRKQVKVNLGVLNGPKVRIINAIDESSPPVDFAFINENVIGEGVEKVSEEFMGGCQCKKDNGRNMGCEHLKCLCVQSQEPDATTQKRHFPYSASDQDYGCLRGVWLKGRRHICECNANCTCDERCKNRVVQHGRQLPLEIVKTTDRGWGLRCPEALLKGQFIDTYRGEIITNEESNRRNRSREAGSDNYMFSLDKLSADVPETITKTEFLKNYSDKRQWHRELVKSGEYEVYKNDDGKKMWRHPLYREPKYAIDGMHMGGPTRFINHSCEPNCAIYTVSYNHSDEHIYELAFFAMEDIHAFEELTFDYKDNDYEVITDAKADELEKQSGERPTKCLCGSERCRGYFFSH